MKRIEKIRLLLFIGSLTSGGKERRFIELLTYLTQSNNYDILVVTTYHEIHYKKFKELNIPVCNLEKSKIIGNLAYFSGFYKICKQFNPDLIHTWGRMQTFYSLSSKILRSFPLINGQITNASPVKSKKLQLIDKLNFYFSDFIVSNSKAGIKAYKPPLNKSTIIYNGVSNSRFQNLSTKTNYKEKFGIVTPYLILMVATFSKNKDYERFFKVAKIILRKRQDVTFVGVGYFHRDDSLYKKCLEIIEESPFLKMTGEINDVEELVNISDIGVLFSNKKVHGEGISNAIIEYMALGKPVVANDTGGTVEIVENGKNGVLISDELPDEIAEILIDLLNDSDRRKRFGCEGKKKVNEEFTLQSMGEKFEGLYNQILER